LVALRLHAVVCVTGIFCFCVRSWLSIDLIHAEQQHSCSVLNCGIKRQHTSRKQTTFLTKKTYMLCLTHQPLLQRHGANPYDTAMAAKYACNQAGSAALESSRKTKTTP
jgi:hypothetical protein